MTPQKNGKDSALVSESQDKKSLSFVIKGKIKPYVRMTRRGKWVNSHAQEYLNSQEAIAWQLKEQMNGNEILPDQTPLRVNLVIEQPKRLHSFDLENVQKAILDAAQGIVFKNDCWIDVYRAERRQGDDYRAYLWVGVL